MFVDTVPRSDGDGFLQVPVKPAGDPKYKDVKLPQRYFDLSSMTAHFPAGLSAVSRLLPPGSPLQPVQLAPGLSLITLGAVEYRKSAELDSYNEFAVMVPVLPAGTRDVSPLPVLFPERYPGIGFYIHSLPVSTEKARHIGVSLWGFPKFVAQITFKDVGWMRRCEVTLEGERLVTLDVRRSETRTAYKDFVVYPVKPTGRGIPEHLSTLVRTHGQYDESKLPGGASFRIGPGNHPLAVTLRGLGMLNVAVGRLYAFAAQSLLYEGVPLRGRTWTLRP